MNNINKNIILVFLCLIIFPLLVKADIVAPQITSFDVVVIKEEGINLYDYDKKVLTTIPYNTVLTVIDEIYIDDNIYYSLEYNNHYGYVKDEDIALKEEILNPQKVLRKQQKKQKSVFSSGVYLYNGPSSKFAKASKKEIPIGTILDYEYSDDYYIYTEYNGVKGWVLKDDSLSDSEEKSSLVDYTSNGKLYVLDDTEIYQDQKCTEKLNVTIPKNIEIDFNYSYYYITKEYYVDYNGTKGWIKNNYYEYNPYSSNVVEKTLTKFFIYNIDTIDVYSDIDKTNVIGKITNNEIINAYAEISTTNYSYNVMPEDENNTSYVNLNYIEYEKGKYGWIDLKNISYADELDKSLKYELSEDLEMYDMPYGEKIGQIIPSGTIFTEGYFTKFREKLTGYLKDWIYVTYNGVSGWLYMDNIEIIYNDYSDTDTGEDPIEISNNSAITSKKEIAIYAICGAIVLALTVVVTIVLINKKKVVKSEKVQ